MTPPPAATPRVDVSTVIAAQAGNAIEFYDFVVYVFLAPWIGRAVFGTADAGSGVLLSLAAFAIGFVARPLGAIVFGRLADRRGRRPAMLWTIWAMAAATGAIALLPTHAQVGAAAAWLLVACRLVQGLCFGGEVGPSLAFMLEAAPAGRQGLYCAGVFAGQGVAVFAAGAATTLVTWGVGPQAMQDWGWRVPFALAAVAAPLAIRLRRRMPETLPASGSGEAPHARRPAAARIAGLSLAILGGTVANYACTYLPTHASVALGMPARDAVPVSLAIGSATFAFGLLGGAMADRGRGRPVLLGSRLACGALAIPLFAWLAAAPTPFALWSTALVLAATNALNGGALFALMAASFTSRRRATSIAIVYAAGVALFGGSTQFVVAWLVRATGSPLAPGWVVAASSAVALAALIRLEDPPRTRPRPTSSGLPPSGEAGADQAWDSGRSAPSRVPTSPT